MSTTVLAVATRVRTLIQDADKVRWTDAELFDWVNDAQFEVVRLVPTAYTKRVVKSLAAGTRQSLPSLGVVDGHAVLDVPCNVSSAGDYGKAVRAVDRVTMDANRPGWHGDTAAEIAHWVQDAASPKDFYVHPALKTLGGKVELIYAAVPPLVNSLTSTLALDDIYAVAVGYYVAFRAYSKNIEAAANQAAATSYYTLFTNSLKGA
jgi:hypothetical protein